MQERVDVENVDARKKEYREREEAVRFYKDVNFL